LALADAVAFPSEVVPVEYRHGARLAMFAMWCNSR